MNKRFLVKIYGDTENIVHSIKLIALRVERDNMGEGTDTKDLARMKKFCKEFLILPLIQALNDEDL